MNLAGQELMYFQVISQYIYTYTIAAYYASWLAFRNTRTACLMPI